MRRPVNSDSFYALGPERVIAAVESLGLRCTGEQLALNSYENRVYRLRLEQPVAGSTFVVAKFYRPNRWSDAAIVEEHRFTLELAALEIPVVAPLAFDGQTLHRRRGYRFALYPFRPGRAPDLENPQQLEQLGRYLGRIHALGAQQSFAERPTLDAASFGDESCNYLLEHDFIPAELVEPYEALCHELLDAVEEAIGEVDAPAIRLQGDAHPGNILWREGLQGDPGSPCILDFDDARMGPAVQDLWMFLSGDRAQMEESLDALLAAYSRFFPFDSRQLRLIEPLRTLRMLHHAAWLARRWQDPVFQYAFPWFNTVQYWQEHLLSLKEQRAALHEEPLTWN